MFAKQFIKMYCFFLKVLYVVCMRNLFKVLFVFISFCQVVNGSFGDENIYRSYTGKVASSRRSFSDISNNSYKILSYNEKPSKNDRSNCYKSFIESAMVEKDNKNTSFNFSKSFIESGVAKKEKKNLLFEAPKNINVLNNKNNSGSKASSQISIGSSEMVREYEQFLRDYGFAIKANKILELKNEALEEKVKELESLPFKGNSLSDDLGICPKCEYDVCCYSLIRSNSKKPTFVDDEESLIKVDGNLALSSSVASDEHALEKPNKLSVQSKVLDEKIVSKPKLGFFKKVKNGFCNFFKNTFSAIKRIFVR